MTQIVLYPKEMQMLKQTHLGLLLKLNENVFFFKGVEETLCLRVSIILLFFYKNNLGKCS